MRVLLYKNLDVFKKSNDRLALMFLNYVNLITARFNT